MTCDPANPLASRVGDAHQSFQNRQGVGDPVGIPFFKVLPPLCLPHRVGHWARQSTRVPDAGATRRAPQLPSRPRGCPRPGRLDRFNVSRNGASVVQVAPTNTGLLRCSSTAGLSRSAANRLPHCRQGPIVITGTFVAQCAIDDDKIRRGTIRRDLARRREAEQEPAPAREQLFRDQHGKRRAHRAADNAHRLAVEYEGMQLCVIAGPLIERPCQPVLP